MKDFVALKGDPLVICPEGTVPAPGYVMRFKTSAFRLGVPVTPVSVKYKTFLPLSWTTHHWLIAFFNHIANPFGIIEVRFFDF